MGNSSGSTPSGPRQRRALRLWPAVEVADAEQPRAALLALLVWLGVVIALLSSAVHYADGNGVRAGFAAAVSLPILATLLIVRWTQRTPAMLVVTAFDSGEILEVNESFCEITGWDEEEVLGRTLIELDAWQDLHQRAAFQRGILDHGSVRNIELALRAKSGRCVSHLVSAELIEIGGRRCVISQAIDITERKRTEVELERARVALEARVEERGEQLRASLLRLEEQQRLVAVGTLAAGIAHQINNPIGGIAAAAEYALLVQEEPHARAINEEVLEKSLDEARRCGEIVKSVLRFARHEPTKKRVDDLNQTVASASERARSYVEGRGGRLRVVLALEALPVRVSAIDLEQVIVNPVRNAAESRKEGVRSRSRRGGAASTR